MEFKDIYGIGKMLPFPLELEKVDAKLKFVMFPYRSKHILTTALLFFLIGIFGYYFFSLIIPFVATLLLFFGVLFAIIAYVYPVHIYYFQQMGDYNEEMLRAVLRIASYIQMGTSIEYAIIQTKEHLRGTLQLQFQDIYNQLHRKTKTNLGDVISEYTPIWNSVNPLFVKSLRLLQIAGMTEKTERESIIEETVETFLLNYHTQGKRFAEDLANKAKKLIGVGVLLPIMSLMMLPLVSVFMPELLNTSLLFFIYDIVFPTVTLLMALNFSVKRIQTDTIKIENARDYKPMPHWIFYAAILIILILSVPSIAHVQTIDLVNNHVREYSLTAVFVMWIISFGLVAGVMLIALFYINRNKTLWNNVFQIERDLPHLLQSFSTYSNMNLPIENIIPEIIDDYKRFGLTKHPVVKIFSMLMHYLSTTKKTILDLTKTTFNKLCPSKKVTDILVQLISFSTTSQKSSARLAKTIRQQVMSLYKLDDYLRSLLSETIGLINITTSMLAPLLCAASVIMSLVIVKSLSYISDQLSSISTVLGGNPIELTLVDIPKIIPPTIIELVVGIYLIETIIILSVFSASIQIGNDKFQILKTIVSNMTGFLIYTGILFLGFFFMEQIIFKTILGQ